jgi:hypothetical protein
MNFKVIFWRFQVIDRLLLLSLCLILNASVYVFESGEATSGYLTHQSSDYESVMMDNTRINSSENALQLRNEALEIELKHQD